MSKTQVAVQFGYVKSSISNLSCWMISCQVLIMGAGMAGLTAFKTLVKEGITDILVRQSFLVSNPYQL